MRGVVYKLLIEIFPLSRVKAYLEKHLRLMSWRCMVKEECHSYIRERGPDNVNITHMASDLMPFALGIYILNSNS